MNHRVCRLRREKQEYALDIGDDLPPLGNHTRKPVDAVVEKREPRHGPGRLRCGVHGDPDVGDLERQRIIGPVSGHRHDVAAGLHGRDHLAFLRAGDPSEDRVSLEHIGESSMARWSSDLFARYSCTPPIIGLPIRPARQGRWDVSQAAGHTLGDRVTGKPRHLGFAGEYRVAIRASESISFDVDGAVATLAPSRSHAVSRRNRLSFLAM